MRHIFFSLRKRSLWMQLIRPKKVQDSRLFQGKLPHKRRFRSGKKICRMPYLLVRGRAEMAIYDTRAKSLLFRTEFSGF